MKADYEAHRDFDKAIMTLAAGALGLSIAFVHDLAPNPQTVAVLGVAWLMFAMSLLAVMVSFLSSQSALRREIGAIDSGTVLMTPGGTPGKMTLGLNILAAVSLIIGVFSLVVFALINI